MHAKLIVYDPVKNNNWRVAVSEGKENWGSLHMKLSSISSKIRAKSSKLASQSSIFGLQS